MTKKTVKLSKFSLISICQDSNIEFKKSETLSSLELKIKDRLEELFDEYIEIYREIEQKFK